MIFKPKTKKEINDLAWHLHFDIVSVFLRNNRWYMHTEGKCIYLNNKNKCMIYEKRPYRCRQHNPAECERYGKWYDYIFYTPKDLEAYILKNK